MLLSFINKLCCFKSMLYPPIASSPYILLFLKLKTGLTSLQGETLNNSNNTSYITQKVLAISVHTKYLGGRMEFFGKKGNRQYYQYIFINLAASLLSAASYVLCAHYVPCTMYLSSNQQIGRFGYQCQTSAMGRIHIIIAESNLYKSLSIYTVSVPLSLCILSNY